MRKVREQHDVLSIWTGSIGEPQPDCPRTGLLVDHDSGSGIGEQSGADMVVVHVLTLPADVYLDLTLESMWGQKHV